VEVRCRRFGRGQQNYAAFTDAYGRDVTRRPGYRTLAASRG
jgi:hypothetical protein